MTEDLNKLEEPDTPDESSSEGIPLSEFDDVLERPGFIMARKGRLIIMEGTLSPEEHQRLLQVIADNRTNLKLEMEQQVQELESKLLKLNP